MATVDILHPLVSLEWKECQQLPMGMYDVTAVWHEDKLYVGGWTSNGNRDDARLYIYTPTTNTWDMQINTPVYWFGLTIYHSQLMLVGGREYVNGNAKGDYTNKLWTLSEHGECHVTLPPMRTERHSVCAVSYRDHLLVGGGETLEGTSNIIEVFNGSHWSFAQSLPVGYYDLRSTILDHHWYLMGGNNGLTPDQEKAVHYALLDSILASCQSSETSQPSSVWKRLTDVPYQLCSTTVFGSRLVAVGGGEDMTSLSPNVYAYSFHTNSWIHVGDMPFGVSRTCSVVLPVPSGELMVMGGVSSQNFIRNIDVLKATVTVTSYDPDSLFTMSALSRLEGVGIPILTSLETNIQLLQHVLSFIPTSHTYTQSTSLLDAWLSCHSGVSSHISPTWKNLLLIIRLLNLDDLAQRMETYLSGVTMKEYYLKKVGEDMDQELYSGREGTFSQLYQQRTLLLQDLKPNSVLLEPFKEEGDNDMDKRLRLRDDTIFHLKQTMCTLQQKIKDLEYENEELKCELFLPPFEEEVEEKPVALLPVKIKPKEEPLTLEGDLLAHPTVKTELKEEAITMTKAETTSAQPTTATWNLWCRSVWRDDCGGLLFS